MPLLDFFEDDISIVKKIMKEKKMEIFELI